MTGWLALTLYLIGLIRPLQEMQEIRRVVEPQGCQLEPVSVVYNIALWPIAAVHSLILELRGGGSDEQ